MTRAPRPAGLLRSETFQAAVAFLIATLLLTYPVALHVFDRAVGDGGDTWHYVWAQWWLGYVSENPAERLFSSKMLFHPEELNLYTHNLLLTHCVLMWPFERLWGPVVAVNLYFLFSYWLSAIGAYLLIRHLMRRHAGLDAVHPAALLGGLIYAFCPDMTAHGLGHLGLIDMGWMPLFLLLFIRSLEEQGYRNPILAAVVLIAQLYTDYTVSMFTLMLSVGWLACQGPRRWRGMLSGGALPRLVLTGVLVLAAFGPYFLAGARDPSVQEFLGSRSWNSGHQYGAPLRGFITPSPLHPLWGEVGWRVAKHFWLPISDGTVYLGWTVLPLALFGLWKHRGQPAARTAAVLFFLFLWISMGPTLRIVRDPVFNAVSIDDANVTPGMPFTLFHFIGPLRQLRAPARFIIIPMLLLATLAAFGFVALRHGLSGRRMLLRLVPAAWAGLIVLDFLAVPFRTDSIQVPGVYRKLGSLPGGSAVLDLPWGCRDGLKGLGVSLQKSMYYQTVHERPLVGGYITRLPNRLIDQYRGYPFLMETAEQLLEPRPTCRVPGRHDVERELEELRIGVVVLHKPHLSPAVQQFVRQHLRDGRWEEDSLTAAYFPKWIEER